MEHLVSELMITTSPFGLRLLHFWVLHFASFLYQLVVFWELFSGRMCSIMLSDFKHSEDFSCYLYSKVVSILNDYIIIFFFQSLSGCWFTLSPIINTVEEKSGINLSLLILFFFLLWCLCCGFFSPWNETSLVCVLSWSPICYSLS